MRRLTDLCDLLADALPLFPWRVRELSLSPTKCKIFTGFRNVNTAAVSIKTHCPDCLQICVNRRVLQSYT
jgi:hypothetical protein